MAANLFKWFKQVGNTRVWAVCRSPIPQLLLLSIFLWSFAAHPYYVSVTEVEYKPATGEIEIACKVFTDDLELALKESFLQQPDLYSKTQKEKNERFLLAYFEKHLSFSANKKQLKYAFVGSEIQEEACWSYLLIKNVPKLKSLTVFNDLLYHSRKDQINIIHFRVKEKRQSHRLTFPDHTYTFYW